MHIPFCNRICTYCDFTKVLIDNQPVDEYIEALIKEMDTVQTTAFKTIFVGGGTPTALSMEQLETLLQAITTRFKWTEEFTFEANPDELTNEKIDLLLKYGVNRLSIGVQSFNNEILEILGRTHSVHHVERLIEHLNNIGFENYSIDLMYNLPNETMADIEESLNYVKRFKPKHISWYSLIVEPHTVFYNLAREGKLNIANPQGEADIYNAVMDGLKSLGYQQYEISNFSRSGYESEHNKTYWLNDEYYGLGSGSHGYVMNRRTSNIRPVTHYIESMNTHGHAIRESHEVSVSEKFEEEMFLGLRLNAGVSKTRFKEKFGVDIESVYGQEINDLVGRKLLIDDGENIILTEAGRMIGNDVFMAFLTE